MKLGNVMIFGDSYSTFTGAVPQGFRVYYSGVRESGPDLKSAEELWWHRLLSETGATLIQNNSYSGSTVCNTGYNGDCSQTTSFIARINKLSTAGFFKENSVDTVLILGGTNDSWANAPIGEIQLENFEKQDLFSVLPGFCFFLSRVKEEMPNATLAVIVNTELKPEIAEGIKTAARHYGALTVELSDIEKQSGHPTSRGMEQIKEQVLAKLSQELA